jgi:hypothetical protein
MHHCIGTGIEEENLVSSASANLIPVRLRTLIQALVQEIGENCWNESTNEEVKRRGGKSTALYQYLSYKEKIYWMALFDGYADNAPKFKKDKVEIGYKSYVPTLLCDKMALGRYCQFGLNGKVQPGYRMLKLSDRISKLMPPKLKFGRDEMQ